MECRQEPATYSTAMSAGRSCNAGKSQRPIPQPCQPEGHGMPARAIDRSIPQPCQPEGHAMPARAIDLFHSHVSWKVMQCQQEPATYSTAMSVRRSCNNGKSQRPIPQPCQPEGYAMPARAIDLFHSHVSQKVMQCRQEPATYSIAMSARRPCNAGKSHRPIPQPCQPKGHGMPTRASDLFHNHVSQKVMECRQEPATYSNSRPSQSEGHAMSRRASDIFH